MNHFLTNWTTEEYFNQSKCNVPAFSYSVAKTLIQKSPRHAYLEHAKLGGQAKERTKSMDIGQAVHTALLGKGDKFIKSPYDDFRSKEAKEWRDSQPSDVIILKSNEFEKIDEIKSHFYAQMMDCGLWGVFESSQNELIAEYEYDGIYTISMLDAFNENYGVIFDIKTTTDASPDACQRKIIDFGYDLQSTLYKKAVEIIRPNLTGKVRFIFLFIEVEAPYCLTSIELDNMFQYIGEFKLNKAANIWRECIDTNIWPNYSQDIIIIEPPKWELTKIENQV